MAGATARFGNNQLNEAALQPLWRLNRPGLRRKGKDVGKNEGRGGWRGGDWTGLERGVWVRRVGRGGRLWREGAPNPGPRAREERVQTTERGSKEIMGTPAQEVAAGAAPPRGCGRGAVA